MQGILTHRFARLAAVGFLGVALTGCSSEARSNTATTRITGAPSVQSTTTSVAPSLAISKPVAEFVPPVALASFDDVVPKPAHSPENAREAVDVVRIGTIRIPKISLVHPIYEGVWLTVIDEGPGHWPGSARPGERGNTVFPGHRVTHSHPFLNLDQLSPGDEIIFEMTNGTFTYKVRETIIVIPSDIWVVDQHTDFEATLIACHPKHSARQRIVVKSDLVKSEPNAQGLAETNSLAAALLASAP